jgi:hypothetical protein
MARNYDGFYDVQDGCQQCKQEHEDDILTQLFLSQIHGRELYLQSGGRFRIAQYFSILFFLYNIIKYNVV